jgi:hypothetical protein
LVKDWPIHKDINLKTQTGLKPMNQKTESEKRGAAYYEEVLQIVRIKVN